VPAALHELEPPLEGVWHRDSVFGSVVAHMVWSLHFEPWVIHLHHTQYWAADNLQVPIEEIEALLEGVEKNFGEDELDCS